MISAFFSRGLAFGPAGATLKTAQAAAGQLW